MLGRLGQRAASRAIVALCLFLIAAVCGLTACKSLPTAAGAEVTIRNPYVGVDWARHKRCKANLHTHTTGSDGGLTPHDAVDRYHDLGYQVLALTDHNAVTYPWEAFVTLRPSAGAQTRLAEGKLESVDLAYQNRRPAELGMVAIQGCEMSVHHHANSFFSDYAGAKTEEVSLAAVGERNGLVMFNHPGRYTQPVSWYVDFYRRFDHLFGLEVYNQGDRYPNDRQTWDAILTALMPERPVWGYSNDDMHSGSKLGRNWNILLLPERSTEWVRRGLEEGRSYFVYSPGGHGPTHPPAIQRIAVDDARGLIRLEALDCTNIVWISEGQEIHRGASLAVAEIPGVGRYVRALLQGEGGTVAGTQPFGILRPVRAQCGLATPPGSDANTRPGQTGP